MAEVTKPSPCTCNLCNAPITDVFFDCRIPSAGGWADICPTCFKFYGCKVGLGFGQMYMKQPDGRFVKCTDVVIEQ